jgi:ketosteroid isomerase-like protein
MDTAAAAVRWADTWKRAWEALDTDAIVELYAEEAVLSTEPFREPARGREAGIRGYVARVFGEERGPRVWVGAPIVDGDRAAVSWWASLVEDGTDATLAGTSVLRFDDAGLVVSQWDAWNALDARRDPPSEAELT